MYIDSVLGGICLVSFAVLLWQWWEAARLPLHQRLQKTPYAPDVTLFKPLKGCEPRTMECIASWLEQDYPGNVQILFGVADPKDPVLPELERLLNRYPAFHADIILCTEDLGANRKVSSLIQMSRKANGEVWIVSDADILAPKDLVRNIVQPLSDPQNGAVNCLYQIVAPSGFAMSLEKIGVNADFWSQVAQSLRLAEQNFCLGAVMAVNATVFRETGGFEPLANMLADDYHIGNRIHHSGKKIVLSSLVVDSIAHQANIREVWSHQLRWARTICFERPVSYGLSIISNTTFWAVLWLICGSHSSRYIIAGGVLLIRVLAVADLQRRLALDWRACRSSVLVWLKDLFQFMIWLCAFCGNQVEWRGQRFRVRKGGVLELKK
ncbi:MAG: glycosyltransferase [Verrucomicrobia bacterium]|nr:glycosyltransferase [Verrucomicrobiota bacterium]